MRKLSDLGFSPGDVSIKFVTITHTENSCAYSEKSGGINLRGGSSSRLELIGHTQVDILNTDILQFQTLNLRYFIGLLDLSTICHHVIDW